MDSRKDYAAPVIVAEDVLEQTSLACNATQGPPGALTGGTSAVWPACSFTGGAAFNPKCETDVAKGGAFMAEDEFCRVYFGYPDGVVVLS